MAIARFKPDAKHPTKPLLPKVQPDHYKGVVVDDKYQSLHSLTAYAEGHPATVDYYGQILGEHNDVREIDPAQSGVYQQYFKIVNLDLRVSDPLALAYNDDTGLSSVTGTAVVYPDVVPNTYDYFTYKVTRGRIALFRITNVSRLSMNRDSVHQISYQMVGYVDTGDAKIALASLEDKVNKKYFFHGDRLVEGLSPLLKEEDHHYVEDLAYQYQKLLGYYFDTFHNRTYQTLVVPGQAQGVYDKFLVDYLLRIVSVLEHPRIILTKQLGSDNDRYMEQPTFWTAILERNRLYLEQSNKFMGLTDRRTFNRDHYIAGAGMSTIDSYVYPRQTDPSVRLPNDPSPKPSGPGLTDTAGPGGSVCMKADTFASATGDVVLYKRLLSSPCYVLSQSFYTNTDGQCLFEKVIGDYLEGKAIMLTELFALINGFFGLARLEQFYYGPLLLTLMKDARRSEYS